MRELATQTAKHDAEFARALKHPVTSPASADGLHVIRQLQQTVGNRAVQRFLLANLRGANRIQTKLTVSSPEDVHEQEAERVADEVMHFSLASQPHVGIPSAPIQRKCACEEEQNPSQGVPGKEQEFPFQSLAILRHCSAPHEPGVFADDAIADQLAATRSAGEPLTPTVQGLMETAFSRDFSAVRVHRDAQSGHLNRQLNASAFTYGNHIYFNDGMYDPEVPSGRRLLAHELTHVVQQGHAGPRGGATGEATLSVANQGPVPAVSRTAAWAAGAVHEVNNLATAHLNGTPVGVTWPSLNGTQFWSTAAARTALARPTLSFSTILSGSGALSGAATGALIGGAIGSVGGGVGALIGGGIGALVGGVTGALTGGVRAKVSTVPTNTGSFDETVVAPGPWTTVTPKATVGAKYTLGACTGPGNTTFQVNGRPSDAAMFTSNRRHEDHHANDHHTAFTSTIGAWDARLMTAQTAGTTFDGRNQAEAEAALYSAMGGTPEQIADAFFNGCQTAVIAYHNSPAGGPVTAENPACNADCSTSSLTSFNPS